MPTAATIVGAGIGAWASDRAASKAAKGQKKALAAQQEMLGPYVQAGQNALGGVQDFVNQGANFADTQAYKDITNSAKAAGMNLSGNRLTALTDYYANNFRPQRMNELSYLTTLGANAAAGQATNAGNAYAAMGNARAAGALGVANSLNSGMNNLAFLNMYNQNQATPPSGGFGSGTSYPGSIFGSYNNPPPKFVMPGRA